MSDEDMKAALNNERLISSTLRASLFSVQAELLVATAKLGEVAVIARRLRDEGYGVLSNEILEVVA